ncbi:MAG: PKD domain-containing protein [Myxococcota bacterium]
MKHLQRTPAGVPTLPALLVVASASFMCACADGVDSVDTETRNSAPIALLTTPVIAPADAPVTLDASDSFDPDRDGLSFVFEPNDGSDPIESALPRIEHTFLGPGLFTVVVRAIDFEGLEGLAAQDVTVRLEYPEPPDFCSETEDCVIGDFCDEGVCFITGGTLE